MFCVGRCLNIRNGLKYCIFIHIILKLTVLTFCHITTVFKIKFILRIFKYIIYINVYVVIK